VLATVLAFVATTQTVFAFSLFAANPADCSDLGKVKVQKPLLRGEFEACRKNFAMSDIKGPECGRERVQLTQCLQLECAAIAQQDATDAINESCYMGTFNNQPVAAFGKCEGEFKNALAVQLSQVCAGIEFGGQTIPNLAEQYKSIPIHQPIRVPGLSVTKISDLPRYTDYLTIIFGVLSVIGGVVAILRILYASLLYSASAFNVAAKDKAKAVIKEVLMGLALVFLSGVIFYILNPGAAG